MTKRQGKSTNKLAIFDNEDVLEFLNNAKTRTNQVRTFMMVAFGLHPENLRRLKQTDITLTAEMGIIQFKRAKNQTPRRELIPLHQAKAILDVVKRGKLGADNSRFIQICAEQGKTLKRYGTPPVSPMTLRHTAILNIMKANNFDWFISAEKAGCKPETIRKNYVDLDQYQKIKGGDYKQPLDLTKFEFME